MDSNSTIAPQLTTQNNSKSSRSVNNNVKPVNLKKQNIKHQRAYQNDNSSLSQQDIVLNQGNFNDPAKYRRTKKKNSGGTSFGELGLLARSGVKNGNFELTNYNKKYTQYNNEQRDCFGGVRHFWDERNENVDDWMVDRLTQHQRSHACYNKERYLQANCQFVVLDDGDYSTHVRDPDLFVEWNKIQELRTFNMVNCAICLSPPVAAQMTRCGHIYCAPCLLHYAALSDKAWRKCPICFEPVYVKQLKSVSSRDALISFANLVPDTIVTMKLMQRARKSTIIMPADTFNTKRAFEVDKIEANKEAEAHSFLKIIRMDAHYVLNSVVAREKKELLAKLAEEQDEPECVFVQQALSALSKREEGLQMIAAGIIKLDIEKKISKPLVKQQQDPVISYIDAYDEIVESVQEALTVDSHSTESDRGSPHTKQSLTPPTADKSIDAASSTAPSSSLAYHHRQINLNNESYYFYQMLDGQYVFLSTLNTRTLLSEYGHLSKAPNEIKGKLLTAQHLVMTHELRSRYKHLAHLPIGTSFILSELRLDDGLLSSGVVRQYQAEFDKRAQERRKRQQQETRDAYRAEQYLLRRMFNSNPCFAGSDNHRDLSPEPFTIPRCVSSAHQEIEAHWIAPEELPSPQNEVNLLADEFSPPLGTQIIPAVILSQEQQAQTLPQPASQSSTMSFAEMLRSKPKQPMSGVVWGKASMAPRHLETTPKSTQQPVPSIDDDEYRPPPATSIYTQMWISDMLNEPTAQRAKKNKKKSKKEKITIQ